MEPEASFQMAQRFSQSLGSVEQSKYFSSFPQPSGSECSKIKQQSFEGNSVQLSSSDKEDELHFVNFFSPRETAQSLQRRNDNLEMLCFENSEEEPDDIYNRRKKKVSDLMSKQGEQLKIMTELRRNEYAKYLAFMDFVKFFCQIKYTQSGIRTDYYSNKTFCALRNASEKELIQVTKIVKRMFQNIMKLPRKTYPILESANSQTHSSDQRALEFLIIPRFLISKQKINRLARDEELQRNFEFLIFHECLGHYNNEANKKMPEEKQMVHVRELLRKIDGRQKFKRICSINHGNKFLKSYGPLYYELYSKTLEYLKHLDISIKRGKKYETIKKDLEKMKIQTQQTVGNSSWTENESSSNLYSFRSFRDCLNNMDEQAEQSIEDELRDHLMEIESGIPLMQKSKVRKLMSEPMCDPIVKQQPLKRAFKVRKSCTIPTPKTTSNIILIQPPKNAEM